jgi:hypothetical protein
MTCTRCNTGELKVLRGSNVIRSLFEVQCLNSKCRKIYSVKLGLGSAIAEILEVEFARRVSKGKAAESI